jgi:TonB family protein
MYFDFDDRYQDAGGVDSAINRRDGVLLSVVVHAGIVALWLLAPMLPMFAPPTPEELQARQVEQKREQPTFVFVQPKLDMEALKPRPRADDSDKTRQSKAVEIPRTPKNPLPSARGNSRERTEALPDARARGQGPAPEPAPPSPATETVQRPPVPAPDTQTAALPRPQQQPPAGGSLGDALKNLQKYVQKESFDNPNGGVQDLGPLQFDTKGVEFGPWIRRFIAQVRRNWFVPYAAMSMTGRVVLQFNVHKDGRITDLTVSRPSGVDSFNLSAFNALSGSNPTEPLPPEYPDEKAFFTGTFYYNEAPPNRQ